MYLRLVPGRAGTTASSCPGRQARLPRRAWEGRHDCLVVRGMAQLPRAWQARLPRACRGRAGKRPVHAPGARVSLKEGIALAFCPCFCSVVAAAMVMMMSMSTMVVMIRSAIIIVMRTMQSASRDNVCGDYDDDDVVDRCFDDQLHGNA